MKYVITGQHDSGSVTRAFLILGCADQCSIPLRHGEPRMGEAKVWGWDGQQTITPSISCTKCGFHKTLVNGEWK